MLSRVPVGRPPCTILILQTIVDGPCRFSNNSSKEWLTRLVAVQSTCKHSSARADDGPRGALRFCSTHAFSMRFASALGILPKLMLRGCMHGQEPHQTSSKTKALDATPSHILHLHCIKSVFSWAFGKCCIYAAPHPNIACMNSGTSSMWSVQIRQWPWHLIAIKYNRGHRGCNATVDLRF